MLEQPHFEPEKEPGRAKNARAVPELWTFDEDTTAYPYEVFEVLQSNAPCHFDEGLGAYIITRADDVQSLLRNNSLSAGAVKAFFDGMPEDIREAFTELQQFFDAWMVFSEGTDHKELRRKLAPAFSPRNIEAHRERFSQIAKERIDGHIVSGIDLIKKVIEPFAFDCVADYLGLSTSDFPSVKRWCDDLIGFISTSEPEQERAEAATEALAEFRQFLRERVIPLTESGKAPPVIQCGAELPELLFAGMYAQILTGSFDPVTNAIAIGTYELSKDPKQLRAVIFDEVGIGTVVEEVLRYSTPFRLAPRVAVESLTVHGVEITAGSRLLLMLAAANRDSTWFEKPQSFDVFREAKKHLAFGIAGHYCLGAGMARMQMAIALSHIIPQLVRLAPVTERLRLEPYFGSTTPCELVLEDVTAEFM